MKGLGVYPGCVLVMDESRVYEISIVFFFPVDKVDDALILTGATKASTSGSETMSSALWRWEGILQQ